MELLAERLGVSSRHLRRLFLRHLGATPSAVAQTRRLHFAKKLIDETRLPMTEVAVASGFGCVRRFNAAIRKVYQRTPTHIRGLARQPATQPEDHYLLRLRFRPPFHWNGMMSFLGPRATPGIEVVADGCYRRTIALGESRGDLEVSLDEANQSLLLRVRFGDPRFLFQITERVRSMFDVNADWWAIVKCLRGDPVLARRLQLAPGLRVPGCWSGFELAMRAILGQQVTVKGATVLAGRLVQQFGQPHAAGPGLTHLFPTPKALAEADLRSIGLPRARAETLRMLAQQVRDGVISFEGVVEVEGLMTRLREIPGIGPWTAQYVAMRAMGEPDAFPSGDLGLLRALKLKSAAELEQRAMAWRPWRAYAAMYLWSSSGEEVDARREPRTNPKVRTHDATATACA